MASLSAHSPSMQALLLRHAPSIPRAELQTHALLHVSEAGELTLTASGAGATEAATEYQTQHGRSAEWTESLTEADRWLNNG